MDRAGAAPSAAVTTYRHTGRSVPSHRFFVVSWPPQRSRGNLWFHNVSDKMTPCLVTLRGAPAKTGRVFLSSSETMAHCVQGYSCTVHIAHGINHGVMVCEKTSIGGHHNVPCATSERVSL